jgi:hypothetical protein
MAAAKRVQVHVDPPLSGPGPADPGAGVDAALAVLGLRAGETVRWRHLGGRGWQSGVVTRRERDGSVRITDDRGLARSLAVDRLEVSHTGPRGARGWEPLRSRAARSEQLRLL